MKILKVFNCGGCGESRFDSEFDSTGWCMRDDRGIRRYELPDWCPLEEDSIINIAKELMRHIHRIETAD